MVGKEDILSSGTPFAKMSKPPNPRCGQGRQSRPRKATLKSNYFTLNTYSAQIEMLKSAIKKKKRKYGNSSKYP